VWWYGLVSQFGVSHRVNCIAVFCLGKNCPRKIAKCLRAKIPTSMSVSEKIDLTVEP